MDKIYEQLNKINLEKPKHSEYYFGASYDIRNDSYVIKDTPLFLFKKNSKTRILGEKFLNDNNLNDNYTLIYKNNPF